MSLYTNTPQERNGFILSTIFVFWDSYDRTGICTNRQQDPCTSSSFCFYSCIIPCRLLHNPPPFPENLRYPNCGKPRSDNCPHSILGHGCSCNERASNDIAGHPGTNSGLCRHCGQWHDLRHPMGCTPIMVWGYDGGSYIFFNCSLTPPTALGMLPATIAFTFFGHHVPAMERHSPLLVTGTVVFIFIVIALSIAQAVRRDGR